MEDIVKGLQSGIPICCCIQFVQDRQNPETFLSGLVRRGAAYSKAGKCWYVPCFDCNRRLLQKRFDQMHPGTCGRDAWEWSMKRLSGKIRA